MPFLVTHVGEASLPVLHNAIAAALHAVPHHAGRLRT